jgi:hypothetical protein
MLDFRRFWSEGDEHIRNTEFVKAFVGPVMAMVCKSQLANSGKCEAWLSEILKI